MPPLQTKDENDPKRPVKIKFIRNTAHDGTDYGPDYTKKVAEVPFHQAATYIRQGRAEAHDSDEELKDIQESAQAGGQLPADDKKGKK